jgi:hypothetical protein
MNVTDAMAFAINTCIGLGNRVYANVKPSGQESNKYDSYAVLELDSREHNTALVKVTTLSVATFPFVFMVRSLMRWQR